MCVLEPGVGKGRSRAFVEVDAWTSPTALSSSLME